MRLRIFTHVIPNEVRSTQSRNPRISPVAPTYYPSPDNLLIPTDQHLWHIARIRGFLDSATLRSE